MSPTKTEKFRNAIEHIIGESPELFISRNDGVLIYNHRSGKNNSSAIARAVLMCGMWQAAEAMMSEIPKGDEIFRLSFDTSRQGIYILPLFVRSQSFYLGMLYSNEINPASLKQKIRSALNLTHDFILENGVSALNIQNPTEPPAISKKEGFLFENITDAEMDAIFKFAGS